MKEEWKQIEGFEGRYYVSNMGRVKVLGEDRKISDGIIAHRKTQILKFNRNNSGYLTVGLGRRIDNSRRTRTVHRLVAAAFIDNPYGLPEVNHIDENKDNNRADNLEWCTHKENVNHNMRSEIERGEAKQRIPIAQIDMNGNVVKMWDGFKKMDRESEFNRTSVSRCCRGKQDSYKGFRWKYAKQS